MMQIIDNEVLGGYQEQGAGITQDGEGMQAVDDEGMRAVLAAGAAKEAAEAIQMQKELLQEAIRLAERPSELYKAETKKLVSCFLRMDQQHKLLYWRMLNPQSRVGISLMMFERMLDWSNDDESTRSMDEGLNVEPHSDGGVLQQNDNCADFFQRCVNSSRDLINTVAQELQMVYDRGELVNEILALPPGVQEIVMEAFAGTQLVSLVAFGAESYQPPTTRKRASSSW